MPKQTWHGIEGEDEATVRERETESQKDLLDKIDLIGLRRMDSE